MTDYEALAKRLEAKYPDGLAPGLAREAAAALRSQEERLLNNALIHDEEVKYLRSRIEVLEGALGDVLSPEANYRGPYDDPNQRQAIYDRARAALAQSEPTEGRIGVFADQDHFEPPGSDL